MIHVMDGEWCVFGEETYIDCLSLYRYVKMKGYQPITIDLDMVAYKPTDEIDVRSRRYTQANLDQPALVASGMPNPIKKPLRMLDGRHRVCKAVIMGKSTILAFVVTADEAYKFVQHGRVAESKSG